MPMLAVGVTCMVRADIGVAPFDVLNTGVNESIGIPLGLAYLIDCCLFFALGAALGSPPGWASVAGAVVISALLQPALALAPEPEAMAPRIVLYAAGLLVVALAICLVITTDMGPGPSEVMMLGLARHGVPLVVARWIADGTPFLIGAVIGGALGAGTVVFVIGMGPMVAAGLRWLGYTPPARPIAKGPLIVDER